VAGGVIGLSHIAYRLWHIAYRLMTESLRGTARHRAIVRAIFEAYADDGSILTIGVFGSLARANGDEYFDFRAPSRGQLAAWAAVVCDHAARRNAPLGDGDLRHCSSKTAPTVKILGRK